MRARTRMYATRTGRARTPVLHQPHEQSKYDTTLEFELMGRAMGWKDILASLTTNPSAFFKAANTGRVEKGMDADLVVLEGDPAVDVRNFAKVAWTVRKGKVIYSVR